MPPAVKACRVLHGTLMGVLGLTFVLEMTNVGLLASMAGERLLLVSTRASGLTSLLGTSLEYHPFWYALWTFQVLALIYFLLW